MTGGALWCQNTYLQQTPKKIIVDCSVFRRPRIIQDIRKHNKLVRHLVCRLRDKYGTQWCVKYHHGVAHIYVDEYEAVKARYVKYCYMPLVNHKPFLLKSLVT